MRKIVLFIMAFLASLSVQAQGMHWTPVDEGLYSGSTTVIAVVQVNGVEQSSTEMELAVFCGEECRGTAYTTEFPITHRFLAMVNVYGEVGHELSFKAYDHATDQELEMDPVVTVTFTEDGSGTLLTPLELNFSQQVVLENIIFADANVKALCVANWDTNGDGELSYAEAAAVTSLEKVFKNNSRITTFNELQYFTGLTAIGDYEFYYCQGLTSITIPNVVTTIGYESFYYCSMLTSLDIPNSVTTIGDYVFCYCNNMTSLTIGSSVSSIGTTILSHCSRLEYIHVDADNTVFDSRGNCNAIIETATNTLRYGCKNTIIPNTVVSIGNNAFFFCTTLTSIAIPRSVTSIGNSVFNGCPLEQIVVDGNNTVFDSRENCNAIIETASNTLFYGSANTVIPNTVTSIRNGAFYTRNLTSIIIPNLVTSIGYGAFEKCNNLTSVTIGNSVVSIEGHAFYDCRKLESMTVLAEIPPTLGDNYVFSYVNKSIPVYVPCGTVSTYQTASGWSGFTNYQELECPSYEITATANPAEGGTITGAGTFAQDETCTLTATANEDYIFVNWTEAGTPVSTNPTYSFVVTENRTLVANFEFTGLDTPHWTPVDEGLYSGSTTIIAVVKINGEEQYSDQIELGVFCGDECRGTAMTGEFFLTHRYLAQVNVYGENGNQLTFKAYDHATHQEMEMDPVLTVSFSEDGNGTLLAPLELNFASSTSVTQSTELVEGWNWWSTYIEQSGIDGLAMLETGMGGNGVIVKYANQYVQNMGSEWMGSLDPLTNERCYKIQTTAECTVTMSGPAVRPAHHPITIQPKWNWIGYPVAQAQNVASALDGFQPSANDIIKGQTGYATYIQGLGWIPEFTLEPGKGYLYHSNSTANQTLVYSANRGEAPEEEADTQFWHPEVHAYADNLCLLAVVDIDGEEQRTEDLELGAFVGDECRGSARLRYIEPFNRYYAMMTVTGEDGDEVFFKLIDMSDQSVRRSSFSPMIFSTNAVVGSFGEPYEAAFVKHASTEELNGNLALYPNPVGRGEPFRMLVSEDEIVTEWTVFDALGAAVQQKTGAFNSPTIEGLPVSGVYLVKVVCKSGNTYYHRLIIK